MQALHIGLMLAMMLMGTPGLPADEPAPAATKADPKAGQSKRPTDAELLQHLQEVLQAIEDLQRDMDLFELDRGLSPPKYLVRPRDVPPPPADAQPQPATPHEEIKNPGGASQVEAMMAAMERAVELLDRTSEEARMLAAVERERQLRARLLVSRDLEVRCLRAWQAIAKAQARLGDLAAARRSWRRANRGAMYRPYPELLRILIDIALDQDATGDHGASMDTLSWARRSPLPDSSPKSSLRFSLMSADPAELEWQRCLLVARAYERIHEPDWAEVKFAEAIKIAEEFENPLRKTSALVAVASAQSPAVARPDWERTKAFALSLPDDLEKLTALETTLRSCLRAGDVEWVLGTIGEGVEGDLKAYLLGAVADELATAERPPAAETVARVLTLAEKLKFDRSSNKKRLFAKIALAQARLADDAAYHTLEVGQPADQGLQVGDLARKLNVMCTLAHAYLRAGNHDPAKDTVQVAVEMTGQVPVEYYRVLPMADLVRLQAETGDPVGALQTAERLEHPPSKIAALAALAVAQGKAGDRAAARSTIARARKVLDGLTREAMWQYADLSEGERVIRIESEEFPKPRLEVPTPVLGTLKSRAKALQVIVSAQVAIGDIKGALEAAQEIQKCGPIGERERVALYNEIATAAIEAGEFELVSQALFALERVDRRAFHTMRRLFHREIVRDEIRRSKEPGLLQVGLELENNDLAADSKLDIFASYAEAIIEFKDAETPATTKASEAKPSK
jgi:hypothetical protein